MRTDRRTQSQPTALTAGGIHTEAPAHAARAANDHTCLHEGLGKQLDGGDRQRASPLMFPLYFLGRSGPIPDRRNTGTYASTGQGQDELFQGHRAVAELERDVFKVMGKRTSRWADGGPWGSENPACKETADQGRQDNHTGKGKWQGSGARR